MLGIIVNVVFLIIWALLLSEGSRKNLRLILGGLSVGIVFVFLLAFSIEFNWFILTGIRVTEYQSKTVVAPIVEEL